MASLRCLDIHLLFFPVEDLLRYLLGVLEGEGVGDLAVGDGFRQLGGGSSSRRGRLVRFPLHEDGTLHLLLFPGVIFRGHAVRLAFHAEVTKKL